MSVFVPSAQHSKAYLEKNPLHKLCYFDAVEKFDEQKETDDTLMAKCQSVKSQYFFSAFTKKNIFFLLFEKEKHWCAFSRFFRDLNLKSSVKTD